MLVPSGCRKVFLPGFGARAASYALGLPAGWEALQPPREALRSLAALSAWLSDELERDARPALLAGHSMGAALAIEAAAAAPEHVAGVILIGPAGLPLSKPIPKIIADFLRQLARGRHRLRDVAASIAELGSVPVATARLIRALQRLDLSASMQQVRRAGVPAVVIGCRTDTLVTPGHTRRIAALLGAEYHELALTGGHTWMFGNWSRLRTELASLT